MLNEVSGTTPTPRIQCLMFKSKINQVSGQQSS